MVACPLQEARDFVRQKQTEGKIFVPLVWDFFATNALHRNICTEQNARRRGAHRVGELPQNADPHDPDREDAAAESETEQFVIGTAMLRHANLEGNDVAPQADTKRAIENGPRFERRYQSHRGQKKRQGRPKAACRRSGSLP